ncbi:hypothetical protein B0I35DRAFT_438186 [Stachybotrys elegans]|uniref:Galactose oxidase n=1 Tax=Stachybotrys elegans TaxID=80388 RepID=A0A8K0SM39_9HYPO|nr:hypothetical protein B0I35DRAFT_438186 [Stachybotrys elegans]
MRASSKILALTAIACLAVAKGSCAGIWTELAQIPFIPRQEHSAVAINATTLAVLGGIVAVGDGWGNTDLVTYYDIPSDTWIEGPPLPVGLNHPNSVAHEGKIYLMGGLAETGPGLPWVATPETWVLDPAAAEWTSLAPFPEGTERGSAIVGLYDDKIFLAGGLSSLHLAPGGASIAVDTVSSFDILTGEWTEYPDHALPGPKDHAAGGIVGSTLWITGGRHIAAGVIQTRDVLALDLAEMEAGWESLNGTARMPTSRGGHMAGVVGDLIYAFGGEGIGPAGGVFNQSEVFDTKTRTWKSLEPMPLPRHGSVSVVVGGDIYIPGGGLVLGTMPTNTTEVFRP